MALQPGQFNVLGPDDSGVSSGGVKWSGTEENSMAGRTRGSNVEVWPNANAERPYTWASSPAEGNVRGGVSASGEVSTPHRAVIAAEAASNRRADPFRDTTTGKRIRSLRRVQ